MNRTMKVARVRRYHDGSRDQVPAHLRTFLNAENLAKRLKTNRGLTSAPTRQ
jgi:hypothetical protein